MVGKCHENATAEHTSEVRAAVPALSWADTSLNRSLTIPYNDPLLKCQLPVATRVSRGVVLSSFFASEPENERGGGL